VFWAVLSDTFYILGCSILVVMDMYFSWTCVLFMVVYFLLWT